MTGGYLIRDIIERYQVTYGYVPSLRELWGMYTDGELDTVSDEQEDNLVELAEREGKCRE